MLEVILDRRVFFVLIGVIAAVGIISKVVVSFSLKRLTKAAGNMGKSSHGLIRLVRAKYEHACMISDRVQNVEAFIEKYIYEYKIVGIGLHGWRRLERACAWGCFGMGLLAAAGEYALYGMNEQALQNAVFGAAAGIVLFLLRAFTDENYQLEVIRNYMVDYLDNVCARKFEKSREAARPERRGEKEEEQAPAVNPEILSPAALEPAQMQKADMEKEGVKKQEAQTVEEESVMEAAAAEIQPAEQKEKEKRVSRVARKKELLAERAADKEEEKSRGSVPKEVLIREILEEFLA